MPTKSKIQDQTFLFTGTLTEFTRDEAEALVEANGGKVLSGVSAKLNYLVVGEDAGSKLEKAKSLGTVTILTEKEFLAMTTDSSSPKEMPKQKATPSKKPAFKGKKLLDAKTAKKSISDYVDLDEYDSIEPKAASILAAEDSSLNLNGIKYLDLESAKALSKHKGEISLNGLLELDSNVAKELAKHNGSISLDGLKTITSESAQALSNSKFDISLDGIEELDDASFFENHTAYLSLKGLRTLNDKISEQLSKKKGGLDLDLNISDSLKELNPAKAKLLVKYYSKVNLKLLHLDGIKYLDLESAKVLSKFEGKISLNGLLELDSNVAKELAKHNGSISLNGLKTITSESAQALSNSKFDISLDGIEELDDASAFVNHSASLSLQGLSSLNDKISEQLSKKKGGLDLDLNISDSLKELSPAKAKLLVKYYSDPEITLEALEVLTLDAAKELAKHKYSISLNLTEINVEVLNVLSKVDLSLNNVNTLSNDHFKAIANFKKGIALNGLKAIDVKAVKELVKVGTKLELLGVVSISDEVAKILATYKGELHLGCITLSEKSALYLGEVKRKPGKNELHLPNIESPSSIEGKGIDFLMKEGITLLSDFPKLDFNAERVVGICYALRGGWDYAWEIDSDVWESVKEDDEEFATFREIAKAVPDYDDWEPYFPESLKKNFEFYNQLADLCKVLPIKFIKLADEKIKTNKELMMKFLKSYQSIHHLLEVVGEKLQDDKDFVLEAVRAERGNLQYASKRLRDDTDIINCVLDSEAGEYSIGYASDRIRANKEIAARVLLKSGSVLEYLDSTIKGDKELVKIAVNNYRSAIKYAAKVLQSDKDFLLSLNRFTLTEVPKKIFSNVEFVKQIIERIYLNNLITDSGLDSDEAELVKEVFKKTSLDKETLERLLMISDDFTSEIPKEFQNDLGIAKILIAKDVSNLEYIPAGLRKNKELKTFIEHLENNDFEGLTDADLLIIIRYAGRKIDYENAKLFVKVVKTIDDAKRLINIESSAYPHLSADLKENKEIAEMALKLRSSSPGENLNKFPKKLLNDTDFILSLLEKEPLILEYLPSSYKKDKKIALSVLSKDIRCFQHLDKSLFGDNELIDLVIDGIDTNQKQVLVDFHFLECLEKVPDHIKANRDFAIRIARKGYVLNSFRNDKEIVLEALKVNPNASITMNTKKGFVDIRNAYLEVALLAAYRGEEPITEGSALFNRPNLLAIKFLEQIHDSKGKNLDIDAIEFIRASGYSCFHHNQIPSQDYEENDDYDEDENSDNDSDDDDYEDED